MKLSFSTLPCEGWSVEKLIDCCKRHGFAGIEMKVDEGFAIAPDSTESEIRSAAREFQAAGIAVTNVGASVVLSGIGEEEPARKLLARHIHIAEGLGARGVRVFLGTFFKRVSERNPVHDRAGIIRHVREACDAARERGIEVWIETHNEFSTGQVLQGLLEDIDRPNCRIIYDVIHPREFGEQPEETLHLIGPSIAHVHMKDGVPFEDPAMHEWKYTLTGEGQLPLRNTVAALKARGYEGWYSLEWETKWRPELQRLELDLDAVFTSYVKLMKELDR